MSPPPHAHTTPVLRTLPSRGKQVQLSLCLCSVGRWSWASLPSTNALPPQSSLPSGMRKGNYALCRSLVERFCMITRLDLKHLCQKSLLIRSFHVPKKNLNVFSWLNDTFTCLEITVTKGGAGKTLPPLCSAPQLISPKATNMTSLLCPFRDFFSLQQTNIYIYSNFKYTHFTQMAE